MTSPRAEAMPFPWFPRRNPKLSRPPKTRSRFARRIRQMFAWFALLVLLTAGATGLAFVGIAFHRFLFESGYFALEAVFIHFDGWERTGDEIQIESQIRRELRRRDLDDGNMLRLDIDSLSQVVSTHPKVEAATVRKVYPSLVTIDILQRKTAALVLQDGILAIDKKGNVLERITTRDTKSLEYPYITGLDTARVEPGARIESESLTKTLRLLLSLRDEDHPLFSKISEVHTDKDGYLTVYLKGGTEILFGSGDPIRKMPHLETFIEEMGQPEDFDPEDPDQVEQVFLSGRITGFNCRAAYQRIDDEIEWFDEWEETNKLPTIV
ncbi:hypothetical protein HQ520_11515, partial [bacterium]|nr:hypothetical protein [bacterium]